MNTRQKLFSFLLFSVTLTGAQEIIPLDTTNWIFNGKNIIEEFKGKKAVYNQGGNIKLKNQKFLNGTIEFDMFLKETQMFPGVYFRANGYDGEQWFVRPHLSGKPDANQAAPAINGITPWQLYFGSRYSFPYEYKFDDWTHVKLVVNGDRAQVFLDHSEEPNLSWDLYLEAEEGEVIIRGGSGSTAIHIADVRIDKNATELVDFATVEREPISGLIQDWNISDMFEEKLVVPSKMDSLISSRKWQGIISVEEGTAANIARKQLLYNGKPGNTVFAKVSVRSDSDQLKLLEFGYSDRVVVILNGQPIYKGTNKWRSRDYRYLGTVGLFDAVYLPLLKGDNELLLAVSEDFGGWLVTGRIMDMEGIKIKP